MRVSDLGAEKEEVSRDWTLPSYTCFLEACFG